MKFAVPGDRHLVIYSATDTYGLHDSSGAFQPESRAYAKLHGLDNCTVVPISCDRPRPQRRLSLCVAIERAQKEGKRFGSIAYFGHGTWQSIQIGYWLDNVHELAESLRLVMATDCVVALYACSTADGPQPDQTDANDELGPACERGFADRLRDALSEDKAWTGHVDAHKVKGHASWNPYVVRLFHGDETEWIIEPGSSRWPLWKLALRNTDLRHRFPLMPMSAIYSEVQSGN